MLDQCSRRGWCRVAAMAGEMHSSRESVAASHMQRRQVARGCLWVFFLSIAVLLTERRKRVIGRWPGGRVFPSLRAREQG